MKKSNKIPILGFVSEAVVAGFIGLYNVTLMGEADNYDAFIHILTESIYFVFLFWHLIIQIIAFKTDKWYNLRMYVRKHNDFFIMDCKIQVDKLQSNIIKSIKREFIMKKLTKEEKHKQCLKEIKATMLVVVVCFLWHVLTAFLLNSKGGTLFHMPLWFVVSVFGTIILAIIGVFWLLKFVFVDFSYDEEECEDEQ